jgi:hypothetical protein
MAGFRAWRGIAEGGRARRAKRVGARDYGAAGAAGGQAASAAMASAGLTGGEAPPVSLGAVGAGAPGTQAADASGGDSEHRVYIDIRGAAPGMRTGVERASGPAQLSLRTTYALGTTF